MEAGQREAGKELPLLLEDRLGLLGLRGTDHVLTHTNRTVMLSLNKRILRVHRGYAFAPDRVLQAIVRFLNPRVPRALRRRAEQEFLAFPVQEYAPSRQRAEWKERARPPKSSDSLTVLFAGADGGGICGAGGCGVFVWFLIDVMP